MKVKERKKQMMKIKYFRNSIIIILMTFFAIAISLGYAHSLVKSNNDNGEYFKNFQAGVIFSKLEGIGEQYFYSSEKSIDEMKKDMDEELKKELSSREAYYQAELKGAKEELDKRFKEIKENYNIADSKDMDKLYEDNSNIIKDPNNESDKEILKKINEEISNAKSQYDTKVKAINSNNEETKFSMEQEVQRWKDKFINKPLNLNNENFSSKKLGFFYEIKSDNGERIVNNTTNIGALLNKNPLFYYEFHIGKNNEDIELMNIPNNIKKEGDYESGRLINFVAAVSNNVRNATITIAITPETLSVGNIIYNHKLIDIFLFDVTYNILNLVLCTIVLLLSYFIGSGKRGKFSRFYGNIYTEVRFLIVLSYILGITNIWVIKKMTYDIIVSYFSIVNVIMLIMMCLIIPLILSILIGKDLRDINNNGLEVLKKKSLIMKLRSKIIKSIKPIKEDSYSKGNRVIYKVKNGLENMTLDKRVQVITGGFSIILTLIGFIISIFYRPYDGYSYSFLMLFFFIFIVLILICFIVRSFFIQINDIKKSTEKIVKGDFNIELKERHNIILNPISKNLSNINIAFRDAIDKEMKGEMLKSELITNVSDDLKTPLNSIIDYVDMLKDEKLSQKERMECLKTLEAKAKHIKVLIENLFEATKASTGNIKLNIDDVNIVAILKQTLGEFEEDINNSKVVFKVKMPKDKIILKLDGARTWRIFENLISNAIKYSLEYSRVYLNLYEEDDYVIFDIKNVSGYELNCTPNELRKKIKNSNLEKIAEGSGLGLSIANSLVDLQGGTMAIDIDGDLFKVTIKLKK